MTDETETPTQEHKSLEYQLDILKEEIHTINGIIGRIDTITQATKNWAIVTWTASIGFILTKPELYKFIAGTAVLPIVFWFVDGVWRRLQRRSTYRSMQISAFLNDGRLKASYKQGELINFKVFDPTGISHKREDSYQEHISIRRILLWSEVFSIYLTLATISALLGGLLAIGS